MIEILVIFVLTTISSYLFGFPIHRWLIRSRIIDLPNERSSHDQPTVRGGGIAIMAALLAGGFAAAQATRQGLDVLAWFIGSALLLAVVSFVDDQKSLPTWVRFLFHALITCASLFALNWPNLAFGLSADRTLVLPFLMGQAVLFLWISGYTNAFNFMDGINGIASGQAVIAGVESGILGGLTTGQWTALPILFSFVIAGFAAGFLPHNFPRARMFMGDVGSAPLGFLLASLALWMATTSGWWLLLPLALLHANFVLDAAVTLFRRMVRGERWYSAHREHFYQRLIRSGRSHTFVTVFEMSFQVIVLMLMVVYLSVGPSARLALMCAVIGLWLAFFGYCEMEFKQFCRKESPNDRSTKADAVVKIS